MCDGFGFFGPFDDTDTADNWAALQKFEHDWVVAPLNEPSV